MKLFTLTHPTESLSRGIENLVIYGEDSSQLVKGACQINARAISSVVFPIFLILELSFNRIPTMVMAIGTKEFNQKADHALKYLLAIFPSIVLGLYSPEGMPGFFLKRIKTSNEVRPFGSENIFGSEINSQIHYPKAIEDVQRVVKTAKANRQQVSVIGAGMSQGGQTVPSAAHHQAIDTKYLNEVKVDVEGNTVTVGSGASWERIQLALDERGKSAIVKQASDIFSIGGSIAINCHGWAHQYGSISKTVRSLKVVDSDGNLRVLNRPRPGILMRDLTDDEKLFKCMFGTLGYFGVIVEATLDIVDNEDVIEHTNEVGLDQFVEAYSQVKDQAVLLRGRLPFDTFQGDPFGRVYMVSYRRSGQNSLKQRRIIKEPEWGTRIQRIGLKLISHLPSFAVKRLLSYFWGKEKVAMSTDKVMTRNEALHPPINAMKVLHHSNLHAQWLQEYFIEKEKLPNFMRFLGAELRANDVKLINTAIRPTPKDEISILPYAEKDRYAVVICFAQKKTKAEIAKTKKWIENVNAYLAMEKGVFYQAYMPYASVEQFETCYGLERVEEMRRLKRYYDPNCVFGNAHTAKYYDKK